MDYNILKSINSIDVPIFHFLEDSNPSSGSIEESKEEKNKYIKLTMHNTSKHTPYSFHKPVLKTINFNNYD